MILLIFTLTPETMQTTQYRKPRIWEMRVDKYTKSLAKNQVRAIISYARYSEQRFTQIYKALFWETTRCPFEKYKIWPPEPTARRPSKCHVTQKPGNSTVLYGKTKNTFEQKTFINYIKMFSCCINS